MFNKKSNIKHQGLYIFLVFLITSGTAFGQMIKNFEQRTSNKAYSQYKKPGSNGKIYTLKGDFTMIGNTNLTMENYSVSGTNSGEMVFVDVDGDPTTINSSSANLVLPSSCSEVVYAGLYWTGRLHDGNSPQTKEVFRDDGFSETTTTITNYIDGNITHNSSNVLDNTTAVMSLGGSGNDIYPIQTLTIGDRQFEFSIRNDGQIQKRERIVNGAWSQSVIIQAQPSSNLTSSPINQYSNVEETLVTPGVWSNWSGGFLGYGATRSKTDIYNFTRTVNQTLTISGVKTYTLNNPISYEYAGKTYIISKLNHNHKEIVSKTFTQTGIKNVITTETRYINVSSQQTITESNLNDNSNNSPSINTYVTTLQDIQLPQSNYVTVYGPKTTTNVNVSSKILDKLVIKIKKEDEDDNGYVTISPTSANPWGMQSNVNNIHFPSSENSSIYSAYVDVTDYVRDKGAGNYFVADLATSNGNGGSTGYFGGWGMVVIYADNTKDWRDITVFDGYAYVSGNTGYELPLSGFRAVQNGPVKIDIGMMAGEGDRGIDKDNFRIINKNNQWVNLSHNNNTSTNFFNSSIITDGTRNPSLVNNSGIDIVKIEIPNNNNSIIGNNDESTKFYYGSDATVQGSNSNRDTYSIFNIVFAVDAYIPDVEAFNRVTAINAGSPNQILNPTATQVGNLQPGDEVSFSMDIYNYGNDPIQDALLNIEIPYTMQLMSGFNMVTNNATSGAHEVYSFGTPEWINPITANPSPTINDFGGLLRWNIGDIPTQNAVANFNERIPLGRLTYKLKVTENCLVLMSSEDNCSLNPHIDGSIGGTGEISGTPFTVSLVSGHDMECNGEPQLGAVILGVQPSEEFLSNCSLNLAPESILIERFCGGDLTIVTDEVIEIYPEGTVFYSSLPTVPNPTIFNTATDEFIVNDDYTERYYYAVLPGNPLACFLNIRTKLNQIIQTPTIQNIVACKGVPYQVSPSSTTPLGLQVMYFTVDPNEVVEDGEDPTYIPITLQQVLNHWNTTGTYTYYAAYGVQNSTIPCDGVKTEFIITVNNSTINELSDDTVSVCSRKSYVYVPNFNNIPTTALVKWYYVDTQNQRHEYNNLWDNIEINNGELHIYNASLSMNAKKLILVYQDLQTCSLYEKEITIGIENCPIIGNPNIVSPKRY